MKKIVLLTLLMVYGSAKAQVAAAVACSHKTQHAWELFKGTAIVAKDVPQALALFQACAAQGYARAQYNMGMIHKYGNHVPQDYDKAFALLTSAAEQGYARAACELGVLYKDGLGCTLSFDKALQWFEKSYELGFDKGAYSIGYLYFKGLGSIEQDYSKAIQWFSKTKYPMSVHWLAICNYFGYGTPVNKDKAIELLVANAKRIDNSRILLEHLLTTAETNQGDVLSDYAGKDIAKETEAINEILTTATEQRTPAIAALSELTPDNLSGTWSGKLIELDWAGERILRDFPMSLTLENKGNTLAYTATIDSLQQTSRGQLHEQHIVFDNLKIKLPRLYQDQNTLSKLDYQILTSDLEIKAIGSLRYLTGYVDTQVLNWAEPGPPMLMVLANTKLWSANGQELSQELIAALVAQEDDSFITVYPNPFVSDLLIQYELARASFTRVALYSLDGLFSETIVEGELQAEGKQLYYLDGSDYPKGVYVVRVTTDQVSSTQLIIKE